MRQIINFNLSGKQVKEICAGNDLDGNHDDLLDKLPTTAVKLAKVTQSVSMTVAQDLARLIV
ncbi:MAG: hypothetical protein GC204_12925 [Chloroflexi bacterium]|nr:hypothetical protein [Chloroflexota bacterium]